MKSSWASASERKAGESELGDAMNEAGFTQFRCATESPFKMILEAKP